MREKKNATIRDVLNCVKSIRKRPESKKKKKKKNTHNGHLIKASLIFRFTLVIFYVNEVIKATNRKKLMDAYDGRVSERASEEE